MSEPEVARVAQESWFNQLVGPSIAAGGAWLAKHFFDSLRGGGIKSLKEGQQSNTERIIRIEAKLEGMATREDVLVAINALGDKLFEKIDHLKGA